MRKSVDFLLGTVLAGLLILAPIYLAVLLLLKATASLLQLVKPLTRLLPPLVIHENAIALLLIFLICFLVGLLVRTRWGQAGWKRLDPVLDKIPGYSLFRGFMQRLAGDTHEEAWKPALAEIEDALVPAFIIEALADGRFTVFVPAVPAPFTGAVYILDPDRVHPVDVPFARAIQAVSRWGSGCRDLVAAMADKKVPARKTTS
jgi:uncharacterized membrane protein